MDYEKSLSFWSARKMLPKALIWTGQDLLQQAYYCVFKSILVCVSQLWAQNWFTISKQDRENCDSQLFFLIPLEKCDPFIN